MKEYSIYHVQGKKKRIYRMKKKVRIVIVCTAVVFITALVVGAYLFHKRSYDKVTVLATYTESASDNSSYIYYAKGVLKYSRDGIAFFNKKGEELWNQPCQMQSPLVEISGNAAVLGDKGGTGVVVLTKEGVKGEFQTSRPIERLTVSSQGIVGAVLKDEMTPWIVCYDAKGEVLVEQKASLINTGYPLDISISKDGKTLLVVYLHANQTSVSTTVSYYNFETQTAQHEVATKSYAGVMIPTVEFLEKSVSVLVGDDLLAFWEGTTQPKEQVEISIDKEIKSVAYDEERVALVLKNKGTSGYELRVYNTSGKQLLSKIFDKEYDNVKLCGRQVILHQGRQCRIVNLSGVTRFVGTLDVDIQEIYPLWGIDKYMVVSAQGMQKVQLTK